MNIKDSKNKKWIWIFLVILLLSIFIPMRKNEVWINDDEIADVGHYEEKYSNIYGMIIY